MKAKVITLLSIAVVCSLAITACVNSGILFFPDNVSNSQTTETSSEMSEKPVTQDTQLVAETTAATTEYSVETVRQTTEYVQETTTYVKETDLLQMTPISGSEGSIDFVSPGKDNYGKEGYSHSFCNSYNWYREDDEWFPVSYYLEGKYHECSFTIGLDESSKNNDYNSWLEFYDQDDNLIFMTDKFTMGSKPASYSFSVKDVDVLKIDFKIDTTDFMDVSFFNISKMNIQ